MNLYISFRTELLKISRSYTWLLTLVLAATVPLIMITAFDPDSASASNLKLLKGDPWNHFFAQAQVPLSIVFLPLFILLICTLLPQIEYRNNTWKQVLTSPQPLEQIYFSKFLLVQFLILNFLIAYLFLTGLSGLIVSFIYPAFKFFDYDLNLKKVLVSTLQTYVSVLAISAFLFWIGMRFKSFIIPIALGMFFWFVTALLLFEYHWQHTDKFPFAFPLLLPFPKYESAVPFILWCSGGYTVFFLLVGILDFKYRN